MNVIHWILHACYALFIIYFFILVPRLRKRAIGKFASYYTDPESPIDCIYDRDGVRFYAFRDPAKMPALRMISAEAAAKQADLCMTPEMYHRMKEEAKAKANAGNIIDCFVIMDKIGERMEYAAETVTLMNLANCYFLLEGEDPTRVTDTWTEKKMKLWKSNEEMRDFFLIASFRLTGKYGSISGEDILKYLEKQRLKTTKKFFTGSTTS